MTDTWNCYCGKNGINKGKICPNCERREYQSIRDSDRYRSAPSDMYS